MMSALLVATVYGAFLLAIGLGAVIWALYLIDKGH